MLKIAIIGASGYTGVELARLLCNHPEVRLTLVTSRQFEGQPLSQVFPSLRTRVDLLCENPDMDRLCDSADFYFAAVPHKTAMDLVPHLRRAGKKVVDLSADFRLRDQSVYEQWYQPHSSPQFLSEAVYGLPELYRQAIAGSSLVANPGCYPTSIILGLAPLLKAGVIDADTIIADSKSGTSGAGRSAQIGSLFCEVTDGFRAYKVGGVHRHTPEIEQELSLLGGCDIRISFTPHLLPLSRGILSTIYARLQADQTEASIHQLYQDMYADEPFVRVLPPGNLPATQYVRGSNFCDIGFTIDRRTGRIIVLSAIDNIVKGAAGQAVQNMNIMCGFDEAKGLEVVPLFP
jgi:N-acetyl-gamma-glutamyl-phosphate reductase